MSADLAPSAHSLPRTGAWERLGTRARQGGRWLRARCPGLPTLCLACHRWADASASGAAPAEAAGFETALCGCCHQRALVQPASFQARRPNAPGYDEAIDLTICAVPYAPPYDAWVRSLKYHGGLHHGPTMAALMAAACRAEGLAASPAGSVGAVEPPGVVVPVPIAADRLARRGHNPAWQLARPLARALGWPAQAQALRRHPGVASQAGLGRDERHLNLAGLFETTDPRPDAWRGRTVILVDDVLTTGATLMSAATALREAGAATVIGCAFAQTPAPACSTSSSSTPKSRPTPAT